MNNSLTWLKIFSSRSRSFPRLFNPFFYEFWLYGSMVQSPSYFPSAVPGTGSTSVEEGTPGPLRDWKVVVLRLWSSGDYSSRRLLICWPTFANDFYFDKYRKWPRLSKKSFSNEFVSNIRGFSIRVYSGWTQSSSFSLTVHYAHGKLTLLKASVTLNNYVFI